MDGNVLYNAFALNCFVCFSFFGCILHMHLRKVDISTMSKSRRKALYDDLKEEAVRQGHPFAKGEIVWLICRAIYDNMHALHNDSKSNVCMLLMAANDIEQNGTFKIPHYRNMVLS